MFHPSEGGPRGSGRRCWNVGAARIPMGVSCEVARWGRWSSHGQRRPGVAGAVGLAWLLAGCPCAFALNPALAVSQYAHTSWTIREGFTKGPIRAIAQTPDGYLWLGTDFGLMRFDGVRNVTWQPPPDQHLPSDLILSLLAARDGTLWIGTSKGLATWKDGTLVQYPELAGRFVGPLLEDREGSVWVSGRNATAGTLCQIHDRSARCSGEDSGLGYGALSLYEDSHANLWLGVWNGVWRWKPGRPEFHALPGELDGIQAFAEDHDGTLLIATRQGVRRGVERHAVSYLIPGGAGHFQTQGLLRDRERGLWIATSDRGLVHLHEGSRDEFAASDGLTGDRVHALFEDREGSIWVATSNGLDRFRDVVVSTMAIGQPASSAAVDSVLAARDGSVWIGATTGLNRWHQGRMTRYHEPALGLESLFEDDRGRLWVSTLTGAGYLEHDRFVYAPGPRAPGARAMVDDARGNVWIVNQMLGLIQVSSNGGIQQIPWSRLGHEDFGSALATDPSGAGVWLGFFQGGIAHVADGEIRASYAAANGLGEGSVNALRFDRDGTLWASTEGGLSRLKDGRFATLTRRNGLPCDGVHWTIEDDAGSVWLYMPCGLARIARPELEAWTADPMRTIHAVMLFDSSDGVMSRPLAGSYSPQVAKAADGTLWFATDNGVSVVDPRRLPLNRLPPPVHVERVIADRTTYATASGENRRVPLPPLIRDLEIDYTALSLVAPEKVMFRYRLEGWDRDWQDVGRRRQAFYTNLPPRNYRFRVIASNNHGVWNEAGAVLDFSVTPAYYQTTAFRASVVAGFLMLAAALVHLRQRQVARHFDIRLEARVNERTRIARDLHDTLLQSFQGLLMKFDAVTYVIPVRPAEAQRMLESAINQARQAVTEGRDAVQGLRVSTLVTDDLGQAIGMAAEALMAAEPGRPTPHFQIQVQGTQRALLPLIHDEVYRVACEAVRNALRHADAERIEVEIRYDRRQFRLRVRDDGKGLDPKVLATSGRPERCGLTGMQERAALAGGTLTFWSERDSGTEVELAIPANAAYAKARRERERLRAG
jgi:signal transduction histidine kinase/ligand-binding sensor domain-containing protein